MSMRLATDDEQMERVREGDKGAMTALYRQTAPGLTGYLLKMGIGRDEVADLVQETFAKAWRFRRRYEGRGVRPWLYTMARNAALDFFRQRRMPPPVTDHEATGSSAEDEAVASELVDRLGQALSRLPFLTREVVLLSRYSDMSLKEIGLMLDISEGNAKVRLHRGLKALMEELDDRI